MAIGVESTAGGTAAISNTVTSGSITVGSATMMLVAVSFGDNADSSGEFTVSWQGQTGTQIGGGVWDTQWCGVDWYYIANPTAATGTVSASYTRHFSSNQLAIHVITFTGASTTPSSLSTNTTTSTNPTVTVAASSSGDIVVAAACDDGEAGTLSPANTVIYNGANVGSDTDHNSQRKTATGANTVMSWTDSTSANWAASGLAISASGAGGAPLGGKLLLLGVGG